MCVLHRYHIWYLYVTDTPLNGTQIWKAGSVQLYYLVSSCYIYETDKHSINIHVYCNFHQRYKCHIGRVDNVWMFIYEIMLIGNASLACCLILRGNKQVAIYSPCLIDHFIIQQRMPKQLCNITNLIYLWNSIIS